MKTAREQIQLKATLDESHAGLRLDKALALVFPTYSRERLQQWLREQCITINGRFLSPSTKVRGGEEVVIDAELEPTANWQAEAISLNIIFEDDDIMVINKPVGLVVHPAAGHHKGTLVNALLHHAPQLEVLPRAGIVHRLDKDTSGLLVIAKNLEAHTELVRQLQARQVKREYAAIVSGQMTGGGTVDAPIGRHGTQRKRMAVTEFGKDAVTHYRVLERFPSYTYLRVMLETGRTHQIRVHMAHIQHPIVGDPVYAGRFKLPPHASDELITMLRQFKRQALHAVQLGLTHPRTKEFCQWQAELPEDMQNLLEQLRKEKK